MRRQTDRLVVLCTALCVLCTIVTVVVVAPTVLETSSRTSEVKGATKDNCARIHRLVETLDNLIASGREQLVAYEREGTISRAQLRRALADNQRSRDLLGEADCPPRVRKK